MGLSYSSNFKVTADCSLHAFEHFARVVKGSSRGPFFLLTFVSTQNPPLSFQSSCIIFSYLRDMCQVVGIRGIADQVEIARKMKKATKGNRGHRNEIVRKEGIVNTNNSSLEDIFMIDNEPPTERYRRRSMAMRKSGSSYCF